MTPFALILLGFLIVFLITTMWRVLLFGVALITVAAFVLGIHDFVQLFTG
jgi:hypothetical protein